MGKGVGSLMGKRSVKSMMLLLVLSTSFVFAQPAEGVYYNSFDDETITELLIIEHIEDNRFGLAFSMPEARAAQPGAYGEDMDYDIILEIDSDAFAVRMKTGFYSISKWEDSILHNWNSQYDTWGRELKLLESFVYERGATAYEIVPMAEKHLAEIEKHKALPPPRLSRVIP
jgi:hypothetical protein